jgi:hypothetical protein
MIKMTWHLPFDLYYWFVNVLAGSLTLFLAIAFLVIASMAAMLRMPTIMVGMFFALFVTMLSIMTGTIYILVLLVAAVIVGWLVVRLIK